MSERPVSYNGVVCLNRPMRLDGESVPYPANSTYSLPRAAIVPLRPRRPKPKPKRPS